MRQAVCAGLCWVAALGQASGNFDAGVLVQRELRLAGPPRLKINSKTVVREIINSLSEHLDNYTISLEADLEKTRMLIKTIEKSQGIQTDASNETIQKHDASNETQLQPDAASNETKPQSDGSNETKLQPDAASNETIQTSAGPSASGSELQPDAADEGEFGLLLKFLGLLRNDNFLKAMRDGVKSMTRTSSTLFMRSEKRLHELILQTESTPEKDRPQQIQTFYEKEAHIVQTTLNEFWGSFATVVKSAPGFEDAGTLLTPMVARMKNMTAVRFDKTLKSQNITGSASFCTSPFFVVTKEYIPMFFEVQEKTPLFEAFLQEKVPDVAPQAIDIIKQFGKAAAALGKRLNESMRISNVKVCNPVLGLMTNASAPAASDEENS